MQRMQQTSLVRFCDECGFANDVSASECAACQAPLASASVSSTTDTTSTPQSIKPVTITPAPVRAVTPGPLFTTPGMQYAPRHFGPGTILAGRYEIQQEIGSGGFSTVYRAVTVGGQRSEVAIKRIQLDKLSPRQVIDATETFNREITMLARVKGINGIPVFWEHLTDAENWYLVTQYIPGQTLEDYLQKAQGGYLKEEDAVQLGIGLSEVISRLHIMSPPVIFRDLKPSNIMITPEKTFFLIDFGIARNFTHGQAKDTTRLGSPGYAPPEQYGKAQTDQRSDIYSLGATLQTMLTGRDPIDLRAGEASLNPNPPSSALRKLLNQMLDPDPANRPPTMARIKTRLEEILNKQNARRSYLQGMVIGAVLSLWLLLLVSFGSNGTPIFFLGYIPLMIFNMFWKKRQKQRNLPKPSQRHLMYGLFTVLIFAVVIYILVRFVLLF
jgi:serine/threonine protein kinase